MMKKYGKNMKKYEGITLPIYRPWYLEKFSKSQEYEENMKT